MRNKKTAMKTPVCNLCGKAMEKGFIPDVAHGTVRRAVWHRGDPEPALLFGMPLGGLSIDKLETLPITTFRCPECGLLQFYANADEE